MKDRKFVLEKKVILGRWLKVKFEGRKIGR